MAGILRGAIYWANLNPAIGHEQAGNRPVLVLSNNFFNKLSGTVIAAAITSQPQKAGFPLTLELKDNKLPKRDRKSTRLNSSHTDISRMPSSA